MSRHEPFNQGSHGSPPTPFRGRFVINVKRWFPLGGLVILIGAAFAADLDGYFTFEALRDNRTILLTFVEEHWLLASLSFVLLYTVVVALSLPGATIMTLAGGFLFGVAGGSVLTVVGATAGAVALFLIARTALADVLRRKAGSFLARMADGFSKDAFNYLLFLRLVPVFPFWAVNLVPALLGMRLVPFIVATAVGTIPGTIVFSAFGAGLGDVFDAGNEFNLRDALSPTLIAAFVGLGLLSLAPIALKRIRESRLKSIRARFAPKSTNTIEGNDVSE
jgi:uncharacterized membrane protein YdjX (TVP38/TMEM64 family)